MRYASSPNISATVTPANSANTLASVTDVRRLPASLSEIACPLISKRRPISAFDTPFARKSRAALSYQAMRGVTFFRFCAVHRNEALHGGEFGIVTPCCGGRDMVLRFAPCERSRGSKKAD